MFYFSLLHRIEILTINEYDSEMILKSGTRADVVGEKMVTSTKNNKKKFDEDNILNQN